MPPAEQAGLQKACLWGVCWSVMACRSRSRRQLPLKRWIDGKYEHTRTSTAPSGVVLPGSSPRTERSWAIVIVADRSVANKALPAP